MNLDQCFQPFSFHGPHKLITTILQHNKNIFFADLTKIQVNFDSFTPNDYCCVDRCHFLLLDNLREKRSAPLTKQSGIACFKNPCSAPVGIRRSRPSIFDLRLSCSTSSLTSSINRSFHICVITGWTKLSLMTMDYEPMKYIPKRINE